MEITYETRDLREIFQFPAKAVVRYGPKVARLLALRFADLRAAPNAAELAVFSPEQRTIQGVSALELYLADGHSVVLLPSHPKRQIGSVGNWESISRMKICHIVRAHEQV